MWMGFYKRVGFYKVLDAPTTNWIPLYPVFTTLSKGLKFHHSGNASDRPLKAHSSSQCADEGAFLLFCNISCFTPKERKKSFYLLNFLYGYKKFKKWGGGRGLNSGESASLSPPNATPYKIYAREDPASSIPGVFLSNSQGFFLKDAFQKEIAAVVMGDCLQCHFLYSYYYNHSRQLKTNHCGALMNPR